MTAPDMNVLFLAHSFPRYAGDAPGSFILRLARALKEEDVAVDVVAPAAEGYPAAEAIDGVQVHRFHYAPRRYETLAYAGNMAAQFRESWSARLTMLGFLGAEFSCATRVRRQTEPALVHAHWWFPNGLVGTWLSRLAGIPLVTTMHGTDVRLARTVAFSRPAFRHVLRHSAAVTTVSRWLAAETEGILRGAHPTVAPMPVAVELFRPPEPGERHSDRLLFVGRLNAQKGLAYLLRAMAQMGSYATLDVVGAGEDEASLRALAGALGIGERVRWHAPVAQPELAALYRAATALVVPSIEEGLGMVAVEAQLCRTPVVAFESGGLTDIVQHDRTGLLVPPADIEALARTLDDVLGRPDRGAPLGEAGRMYALATFAPESVARRYVLIYRQALGAEG